MGSVCVCLFVCVGCVCVYALQRAAVRVALFVAVCVADSSLSPPLIIRLLVSCDVLQHVAACCTALLHVAVRCNMV